MLRWVWNKRPIGLLLNQNNHWEHINQKTENMVDGFKSFRTMYSVVVLGAISDTCIRRRSQIRIDNSS